MATRFLPNSMALHDAYSYPMRYNDLHSILSIVKTRRKKNNIVIQRVAVHGLQRTSDSSPVLFGILKPLLGSPIFIHLVRGPQSSRKLVLLDKYNQSYQFKFNFLCVTF